MIKIFKNASARIDRLHENIDLSGSEEVGLEFTDILLPIIIGLGVIVFTVFATVSIYDKAKNKE